MVSASNNLDPEKQPALVRVDMYEEWRKREGVPLVGGVYIKDMKAVGVGPWPRKGDGVKGALCYLDGDDEGDEHDPGSRDPLKHHWGTPFRRVRLVIVDSLRQERYAMNP